MLLLLLLVAGVIGASDYRPSCPLLLLQRLRWQRCRLLPSGWGQALLLLLLLGRGAVRGKAVVPATADSRRDLRPPLMCGATRGQCSGAGSGARCTPRRHGGGHVRVLGRLGEVVLVEDVGGGGGGGAGLREE